MALFAEYKDPRIVALYDTVCPWGEDTDFYLDLAAELNAATVVDVGCGTGLLACELARRGCEVIGVDPSPVMLEIARARPGGDVVRWIEGEARRLGEVGADLALMTAHVAQVIADDASWQDTLDAIGRAVRPGGHLAFESRLSTAAAWAAANEYETRRTYTSPVAGSFEFWLKGAEVCGDVVRYELHYLLADGTKLVSTNELRFRTQAELTTALAGAGFTVEHVFGDWNCAPARADTPELIFVAKRERATRAGRVRSRPPT